MCEESTTIIVQRYLEEFAADSPAEPVVRALLDQAVRRLHLLCAMLLFRNYPRLKDSKLAPADRASLNAQYADRAMEFLRQAVANGFEDPDAFKTDPDLAPLRSREDSQKLLQEVEQKSKK